MLEIRLRSKASPEYLESVKGKILAQSDIDVLLTGSVKVFKPNGQLLLVYLPKAIPEDIADDAYKIFHSMHFTTTNRGLASGSIRVSPKRIGTTDPERSKFRTYALPVPSGIIGSMEATGAPEHKHCRLTAWSGQNMPQWQALQPYFQTVAQHFAEEVPVRYAAQMKQVDLTKQEWVIPGTPFTTVTVNNCVDSSTECLTKRLGWTKYTELQPEDELLAYNIDEHSTRWEKLDGVFINEQYQGDMVLLSNSRFSALTTPDHRWPIRKLPPKKLKPYTSNTGKSLAKRGSKNPMYGVSKYPDYDVRVTSELPFTNYGLVRSAPYEGPSKATLPDWLVRIVAWYITEGSLRSDGKGIGIAQDIVVHPQFVEEISNDLVLAGAQPTPEPKGAYYNHIPGQKGNVRREGLWYNYGRANQFPNVMGWGISGTGVDEIIACAPGKDKIPTMEFLSLLTAKQAQMFVDVCLAGDSTKRENLTSIFSQHVKGRMDAFSIAAVMSGMAPSVWQGRKDYEIYVCALNESYPYIWLEAVKRETIFYIGPIWCPKLPSGHWVARREGRTFITGNTYPTGVHQDKGDLHEGFSCLGVLRRGSYSGGFLTFPEFRTAVNLCDRDLILMDAHEWHGNVTLEKHSDDAERISVVMYFRTNFVKCGTSEEEMAKETERSSA